MQKASVGSKVRKEKTEKRLSDQLAVLKSQLDGFAAQYNEVLDSWKLLDTKAQIASATAGIFLAGVFTVLRGANLTLNAIETPTISVALAMLGLSVCCGIRALELRTTLNPPRGAPFAECFEDFYATQEFRKGGAALQERMTNFLHDQVRIWNEAVQQQVRELESKSWWTKWAQRLLAAGVIAFCALTLYQIWK